MSGADGATRTRGARRASRVVLGACAAVVAVVSCGGRAGTTIASDGEAVAGARDSALGAQLAALADSGAAAWNRGDLRAFLAPYADSVTVVYDWGPETGLSRLRERQEEAQPWNGTPPPRRARAGASSVRRLGPDHAVQAVRLTLSGGGIPEEQLWVTSVWVRTPQGWRVLHEQSF